MPVPLHNQVAVSGTAQRVASSFNATAYTMKAPGTNNQKVYIGNSGVTTANGYPLDPGETFEYEHRDQSGSPLYQLALSDFWVVGTAGDILAWFASP